MNKEENISSLIVQSRSNTLVYNNRISSILFCFLVYNETVIAQGTTEIYLPLKILDG